MNLIIITAIAGLIAQGALAQPTWEQFRERAQSYDFEVYEAARLTEGYRYMPNPSNLVKPIEQFMADGGGDCDDFTHVWQLYLLSHGVPNDAIKARVLNNSNGTYHQVLIVGDYVLSAGPDAQGVYEKSYLELWK